MTFYNIIFGILFIGASREVAYYALDEVRMDRLLMAVVLSLLIFSDTIYTSTVIEEMKRKYRLEMKFVDLGSFILLAFAVVILHPNDNDLFEIKAQAKLEDLFCGHSLEAVYWFVLAIYMLLLAFWNTFLPAHGFVRSTSLAKYVQPFLAVLMAAAGCAVWFDAPGEVLASIRLALIVATGWYLFWFKITYCNRLTEPRVLLGDFDENRTREWTEKYPGFASQLTYALGASVKTPGGIAGAGSRGSAGADTEDKAPDNAWLRAYDGPDTIKSGIWHDDVLCGFTLLVPNEENPREAEFYIALKPEMVSQGLGGPATKETLRRAFKDHGFERVYLRVRHWYKPAQELYYKCGFRFVPTREKPQPEEVNGYKVEFLMMESSPWHRRLHRWSKSLRPWQRVASIWGRLRHTRTPTPAHLYRQTGVLKLNFAEAGARRVRYPLGYEIAPELISQFEPSLYFVSVKDADKDGFLIRAGASGTITCRWTAIGRLP